MCWSCVFLKNVTARCSRHLVGQKIESSSKMMSPRRRCELRPLVPRRHENLRGHWRVSTSNELRNDFYVCWRKIILTCIISIFFSARVSISFKISRATHNLLRAARHLHYFLRVRCVARCDSCRYRPPDAENAGQARGVRQFCKEVTSGASAPTHHSFGGSFSAGSTPIFASKYAFF